MSKKGRNKLGFYQKYRPRRFQDIVGQEMVVRVLRNQVMRRMTHHAYLFTGPSGVGKTSAARILAMALNCERPHSGEPCLKCPRCRAALSGGSWDVTEFDAASFRGIDGVRDLSTLAQFAPLANYKVYIMDEVHQLTEPAWYAMLRLLEEPSKTLTIILCTSEPQRVPETARSRCQLFEFASLGDQVVTGKLGDICRRERLGVSPEGLGIIVKAAAGNLRTAETILEQAVNLDHGSPTLQEIKELLRAK